MKLTEIILILIILIAITTILIALLYNKIKTQILKINCVESKIDEALRDKYDLITKLIAEVEKDKKNENNFKDIDKIKDENLSSFEFERKLADIEKEIYSIKNDNVNLQKNSAFTETWYEMCNINSKIKGDVKYYNDNISIYNNLVSKFPSKLIAIFFHFKERKYFDGKNMYDNNIKDFKI